MAPNFGDVLQHYMGKCAPQLTQTNKGPATTCKQHKREELDEIYAKIIEIYPAPSANK